MAVPGARIQRQIDRLLDEAEEASARRDWAGVLEFAKHALTFDPENADALALVVVAERGLGQAATPPLAGARPATSSGPAERTTVLPTDSPIAAAAQPTSFVGGRYAVKRFLGEGGKKKVYLAHDTVLARDVAFALIKTQGLDAEGLARITREAQAMAKLGDHPNIVTLFDIGEEEGQPYLVTELMGGGDVEGLIEHAPDHRLTLHLYRPKYLLRQTMHSRSSHMGVAGPRLPRKWFDRQGHPGAVSRPGRG